MASIYEGREMDVVVSRDKKERTMFRGELAAAIKRHLDELYFWNSPEEDRTEYIKNLSSKKRQNLRSNLSLLVPSLEGGKNQHYSFASWYRRIGRALGAGACRRVGIRVCNQYGFTVEKGREILTALEPYAEADRREKEER